jgi:GNAT superfamily N-acetyltransferase
MKEREERESKTDQSSAMSSSSATDRRDAIVIRPATISDVRDISKVMAAAFIDNEVMGDYLFPRRREYPQDYLRHFRRMVREHIVQQGRRVIVAIIGPAIVGMASWERQGPAGIMQLPSSTVCESTRRLAVWGWNYASHLLRPDRAMNPENWAIFYADAGNWKRHWTGAREETWYLNMLCVHPEFQGKGVGKGLVAEGIEWAKKDAVCASVIASAMGDGFYDKMGFVTVGSATEGALKGIPGGNIKFFEEHLTRGDSADHVGSDS